MIRMHVTFYELSSGDVVVCIKFNAGEKYKYLTKFYTLEGTCVNGRFKNNLHAVQSLAGYMGKHKKIKLISLLHEIV